jgi:hypothetical protein
MPGADRYSSAHSIYLLHLVVNQHEHQVRPEHTLQPDAYRLIQELGPFLFVRTRNRYRGFVTVRDRLYTLAWTSAVVAEHIINDRHSVCETFPGAGDCGSHIIEPTKSYSHSVYLALMQPQWVALAGK